MNKSNGRPPLFEKTMKQTAVRLRPDQLEWLQKQKDANMGSHGELIRKAIDLLMKIDS